MTSEITQILDSIAATGATESSDPLREYILALEQSNAALKNENEGISATLVSYETNCTALREQAIAPLNAQIATLQSDAATNAALTAVLQSRLDAINAIVNPPPAE